MGEKCPIPKILLAIDDSDNSRRAVEHIACLAGQLKGVSKITLLHVHTPSEKGGWVLDEAKHGAIVNKVDKIRKERFEEIFEEAEEILKGYGIKKSIIDRKIMIGDPAEEIIKEAERGKHTTIVMGKRGRSKIAEILVGSVTKTVVDRAANLDIYIVK